MKATPINFSDYEPEIKDQRTKLINNWTLKVGCTIAVILAIALFFVGLNQSTTARFKIEIRDIAAVFTAIIVTTTCIYHALNLEMNYKVHTKKLKLDVDKWNHDIEQKEKEKEQNFNSKVADDIFKKKLLTSERCLEWHRNSDKTGKARAFIAKHKDLLNTSNIKEFVSEIEKEENLQYRMSIIFVMNYFENIAEGIEKQLLDEDIAKDIFKTMFQKYMNNLKPYFDFLEKREGESGIYKSFKKVADRWK